MPNFSCREVLLAAAFAGSLAGSAHGAGPDTRSGEDVAEEAGCRTALDRLGVGYEERDPVLDDEGCGIERPLGVDRLPGEVELVPQAILTCESALALARWTVRTVAPAAEALGEEVRLTRIDQASSHVCRDRSDGAEERSEHARGGAVDISAFGFDGHDDIVVGPREGDGTIVEAFQTAVRAGACLEFTTVLGPGTDEAHADHLHLDVKARNNGYRICQ